jgi:hypothetical protein
MERLKGGPPLGVGDSLPEPWASRRDCGGLGKGQAAQVVGRGFRLAACRKKGPGVGPQEANPGLDVVARMTQLAIQRKLGAEERCVRVAPLWYNTGGAPPRRISDILRVRAVRVGGLCFNAP